MRTLSSRLHLQSGLSDAGLGFHGLRQTLQPADGNAQSASQADSVGGMLDLVPPILPDTRAVADVERLDRVAWLDEEHHPIVHERRRLLTALPHRPGPRQPQAADVGRVDLVERAVPPMAVRPAPHEPVFGRRVDQHLLRDWRVAVRNRLRGNECAVEQQRTERWGSGAAGRRACIDLLGGGLYACGRFWPEPPAYGTFTEIYGHL